MSDASETHQLRFAWRRCRSTSFLFVSMFHQTDTVLSAEVSIFLTLSDVSLALAEEQTDCRVWFCVENGYGDEEEEEGSRWWRWGRVIHDNMGLQWGLLLPLPVPAAPAVSGNTGRLAGGIIYHIFSSSFHFLQYFTHPPFSKTPALAVIHAPSFISIFSGCSSGLWQISISIVRPGKEPNGPYRLFLCSWSPLSLCTGRGGSFLPLFFWFLSALCVFVCVCLDEVSFHPVVTVRLALHHSDPSSQRALYKCLKE